MRGIIDSIRAECLRYKELAEAAIGQLDDSELSASGPDGGNSVATLDCFRYRASETDGGRGGGSTAEGRATP